MSSEHPGDVFDRSQPTADRPAVPAVKEALGLCGVKTAPEFSEKFFQLPGSGDLHPQERSASNFIWSVSCQSSGFFSQTYLVPLSRSLPWECNWRFSVRRT